MGNKQSLCCQQCDETQKRDLPPIKITVHQQSIKLPYLLPAVSKHMSQFKPFQIQLPRNAIPKKFGNAVYQGQLSNKGKPHGYGTMYLPHGYLYVGQFQNGKASGIGHYVFPDGSYYHGNMYANQAQSLNGQYHSQNFIYKGGFRTNMFEGKGEEKGQSHSFVGHYHSGKKSKGILTWIQKQYDIEGKVKQAKTITYEGTFDQKGQFNGFGKLTNQFGQYKGQYKHGKKHGKGQFEYKTGVKYVGDYLQDIRQGEGTIYTKNGNIAFCGQMKNGLPNGRGYVMNNFGDKVFLNWINGLDQRLLQNKKYKDSAQENI